jgi:hypothetical protein
MSMNIETVGAIIAIAGTVCGGAWTLFTYFRDHQDKPVTTVISGNIFEQYDQAVREKVKELKEQSLAAAADPVKLAAIQDEVKRLQSELESRDKMIADLKRAFREIQDAVTPPELNRALFPPNCSVRSFEKGRYLAINIRPRIADLVFRWIFMGWGVFLITLAFRQLLVFVLAIILFYVVSRYWYIKFDLIKKTVSIATPGAWAWGCNLRGLDHCGISQRRDLLAGS